MKTVKDKLGTAFATLFGIYAVTIWIVFLIAGGALILVLPGLNRRRRLARRALRLMFVVSAMPHRFRYLERLPDSPCIAIANHRSYLDGLVLVAALPPHFRPVIKYEMRQVPIIGQVLNRIGSSFVQRTPVQRAGRDTLYIYDELLAGDSIVIFPEGSFSPDAGLLPFRDGAFVLAAESKSPVVPIAMSGTNVVLPDGSALPRLGRVTVDILDPVYPGGSDDDSADHLRATVEHALAETLIENRSGGRSTQRPAGRYRSALDGQRLPLAYLDLDALEQNIRMLIDASGGKNLRVDARALQCPEIVERVVRSHARIKGAICATVAVAHRLLARQDITDVTIAFPTLNAASLDAVCHEITAGHTVRLTIDSPQQIEPLTEAAKRAGVTVPVLIEIDCSRRPSQNTKGRSGYRSAIRDPDTLASLASLVTNRDGVRFDGASLFDAARDYPRDAPHNVSGPAAHGKTRRSSRGARRIHAQRERIISALAEHGIEASIIACDGNQASEIDATDHRISELIIGNALYGLNPADPDDVPAAGIAAEVIRQPGDTIYACLGGGAICASTSDPALLPVPIDPPGAELGAVDQAGIGQLPIRYAGRLALGEVVFLRPPKANALCDYFNNLVLLQDDTVIGQAATDRALASPGPAESN